MSLNSGKRTVETQHQSIAAALLHTPFLLLRKGFQAVDKTENRATLAAKSKKFCKISASPHRKRRTTAQKHSRVHVLQIDSAGPLKNRKNPGAAGVKLLTAE